GREETEEKNNQEVPLPEATGRLCGGGFGHRRLGGMTAKVIVGVWPAAASALGTWTGAAGAGGCPGKGGRRALPGGRGAAGAGAGSCAVGARGGGAGFFRRRHSP